VQHGVRSVSLIGEGQIGVTDDATTRRKDHALNSQTVQCVELSGPDRSRLRRILGWRVSMSKAGPLVMAALEQALFTRRRHNTRFTAEGLVFHERDRVVAASVDGARQPWR
jgi:hypothetical protein